MVTKSMGKGGEKKQIALWAYELTFTHPVTKGKMQFCSKPENIGVWTYFK